MIGSLASMVGVYLGGRAADTVRVRSTPPFVPNAMLGNGDLRVLSLLIKTPAPSGNSSALPTRPERNEVGKPPARRGQGVDTSVDRLRFYIIINVKGFVVLPKRWIVERTLGWLNRSRRLAKDFEAMIETSCTWLMLALGFQLLRRLARDSSTA
jgi:hypothetical protein